MRVNFPINAAFEIAAFIRGQRLFRFSLPKRGVYWRAEFIKWRRFKRGKTVYTLNFIFAMIISVLSAQGYFPLNKLALLKCICIEIFDNFLLATMKDG